MTESRRDFLRFVLAGSVAAGCPIDPKLLIAAPQPAAPTPQLDGDHFEICHKIRDGQKFIPPPVSKRYDIVIVGGGIAGLSSAYFLRDKDFLLLEKEPHWGGNAYKETYEGQGFATGSAYDFADSDSAHLATGGFDGQVRLYRSADCNLEKAFIPVPLVPAQSAATGGMN